MVTSGRYCERCPQLQQDLVLGPFILSISVNADHGTSIFLIKIMELPQNLVATNFGVTPLY